MDRRSGLIRRSLAVSTMVNEQQDDWNLFVRPISYGYNTYVHLATNETPYMLVFMRDPTIPSSSFDHITADNDGLLPMNMYVRRMEQAQQVIEEETNRKLEKDKQATDSKRLKNAKVPRYDVGDKVWLYVFHKRKGLSKKLHSPWQGPYRVSKIVSPVLVKLKTLGSAPMKQLVNVLRLKPYREIRPIEQITLPDDDTFDYEAKQEQDAKTQTDQFEVDSILATRKRNGRREFLVMWKGFTKTDSTWEPEENLGNCKEILLSFLEGKGFICGKCGNRSYSKTEAKTHEKGCKG